MTVFLSNLYYYLIKIVQLFPACFINKLFVALSLFIALSNFRHLIKLLSSSHHLLSTHFLHFLRTL